MMMVRYPYPRVGEAEGIFLGSAPRLAAGSPYKVKRNIRIPFKEASGGSRPKIESGRRPLACVEPSGVPAISATISILPLPAWHLRHQAGLNRLPKKPPAAMLQYPGIDTGHNRSTASMAFFRMTSTITTTCAVLLARHEPCGDRTVVRAWACPARFRDACSPAGAHAERSGAGLLICEEALSSRWRGCARTTSTAERVRGRAPDRPAADPAQRAGRTR